MEIKGLDEFSRHLKQLAENASKIDGTQNVPLPDLLTPEFMSAHTRFPNAQALFDGSGFKLDSVEDLKAIPDEDWDRYIQAESSFSSWRDMLSAAGVIWMKKKLGL
ncbi:hypothetical protein [Herbaspirillum sp. C9C3]|uniref:hypothetical protein n=1 Tax=Herbaspirillum sp. C9C3 TaxID=2735271 RepID=UPI001584EF81|nr:hypothetical protein [Herbaspirillum sp. C9C3]NUT60143.1 hypothetical protein [Herbaspirillum sp. C9C3]